MRQKPMFHSYSSAASLWLATSPQCSRSLFMADDDWRFATLGAKLDPSTGLVADETPPYARYPANFNWEVLGRGTTSSQDEVR